MEKFDSTKYKSEYNKQKYTCCNIRIKKEISDLIAEYSENMQVSKAALIQKCVIYCYENYIDVSRVKLDKSDK